jgi:DNA-binding PadR family transcriptional regulator
MDRSLGRFWPRARSKLYEEPKKLVALGLAAASVEQVGRRSRTVYRITRKGRAALAKWHREPGAGPELEFEQLLKVTFAEHGTRADALRTIAAAREWAVERNAGNVEAAAAYREGTGPFQERAAQTMLTGAFLTEFYRLVAEWSDWASTVVNEWPEDVSKALPDLTEQERVLRRARWSQKGRARRRGA